jgi:predicted NUDIX family NTP pyrophosphohydrolase
MIISAGLLAYRRREGKLEVFLVHPGGPFYKKKDEGGWSIPKGEFDDDESPIDAARREFTEETGFGVDGPFLSLGAVRQRAGKLVHAWACEGDVDAAAAASNVMRSEWPRGSGRWITFPEVDRCEWFSVAEARRRINPAQGELLDRLQSALTEGADE